MPYAPTRRPYHVSEGGREYRENLRKGQLTRHTLSTHKVPRNLNRGQDTRANRTRHTTSLSTQPHAKQQLTNAPQTNLTFTRTHTPPERRTMPINRRHRPASQPHSLSHPHARARSPVEPSVHRLRELHRPLPTSHYHTKHSTDGRWHCGRAARCTNTPARIIKAPPRSSQKLHKREREREPFRPFTLYFWRWRPSASSGRALAATC